MQYWYKPITNSQGELVSFAIERGATVTLWHMRNIYNGDLRTGNRESQLNTTLEQMSTKDFPPTVTEKLGKLNIGNKQLTPDLEGNWDIGQHFRELAGLPRIELKVKPRA